MVKRKNNRPVSKMLFFRILFSNWVRLPSERKVIAGERIAKETFSFRVM